MLLEEYRKKRDFGVTKEPRGRFRRRAGARIFVVQKHDASRLHYDFRLEIGGVLVSWAVPKGPSLDPSAKRLAAMTEDHPLEYAGFEGIIPEGQYGAGTVMVWDHGTFEPREEDVSVEDQLTRGEIKITLNGEKLKGAFVLIHTGRRAAKPRDQRQWLLIKQRDAHARTPWDPENPSRSRSVLTGKTLEEIEHGRPAKRRVA
jgi:bifunctional non-homologous end joining protein LigD